MKTFELIMKLRNGADARVLAEFEAADDLQAWNKGMDAFKALPRRNISLTYAVREKGTDREVNNPDF